MLDLFLTFFKIGAFTFGGGYAMISMIEDQCVSLKKWIDHDELLNMTVIAESTPGPIAINCATYVGYKMKGIAGALAATLGVVLPSLFIILFISHFLTEFLAIEIVAKAFAGIRVAVSILIMQAGVRMILQIRKSQNGKKMQYFLIAVYFVIVMAFYWLGIQFSVVWMIICSALLGFFIYVLSFTKRGKK